MAGALLAACCFNVPRPAAAQSSLSPTTGPALTSNSPVPAPVRTPVIDEALRDDANLHDVCFLGSRDGWSVGDRGTVVADGRRRPDLETLARPDRLRAP